MAECLADKIAQAVDTWHKEHPDMMVTEILDAFQEIADKLNDSLKSIAAEAAEQENDGQLRVVELPKTNFNDVPALMRNVATLIESGNMGEITCGAAIFLDADGEPTICGWGRTYDVHSIGMFHIGANHLAQNHTKRG